MASQGLDDDDWLVYGRMAQSYGLKDIARAAYARIGRDDSILSTYQLAVRWSAELGKGRRVFADGAGVRAW